MSQMDENIHFFDWVDIMCTQCTTHTLFIRQFLLQEKPAISHMVYNKHILKIQCDLRICGIHVTELKYIHTDTRSSILYHVIFESFFI